MTQWELFLLLAGATIAGILVLAVVLIVAAAVHRRAEATIQAILLERDEDGLLAASMLRAPWDRLTVDPPVRAGPGMLTLDEVTNLTAVAEGLGGGPRAARRRLAADDLPSPGDTASDVYARAERQPAAQDDLT